MDEMTKALPLQYEDGPDYCTVLDAQGKDFALTVQPALMKAMEAALATQSAAPVGCICQDQHRRGYCTEPGCSLAAPPPSTPQVRADLLRRARQFVADAGCDEDDNEVNQERDNLLGAIDAALAKPGDS